MQKLYLLFLFIPLSCFSQDLQTKKTHLLKVNLASLAFKSLSLEYEQKLKSKVTVSATIGFRPQVNLDLIPFEEQLLKSFVRSQSNINISQLDLAQTSLGYFSIMGEIKYYFKEHLTNGFYIGSNIKGTYYASILPILVPVTFQGRTFTLSYPVNLKVETGTLGLKIGYKRRLSKCILGEIFLQDGYNPFVYLTAQNQTQNFSHFNSVLLQLFEQNIKQSFEIPSDKLNIQVGPSGLVITQTGNISGIDMPTIGINLVYMF